MIRNGLLVNFFFLAILSYSQELTDRSHSIRKDQFVVKWKVNADVSALQQSLGYNLGQSSSRPLRANSSMARNTPSILDRIYIVSVSPDTDIWKVCDSLNASGSVEYAEPIFKEKLLLTPNDPAASIGGDQYYLSKIQAYDAWDDYTGNPSIIVGIIDTGSDLNHEDLVTKYAVNSAETENGEDTDGNGYIDDFRGYDFANNDNDPSADSDPHGTRVAGLVGAATNNQIGIAGVGYNTSIIPLKIFSSINNQSAGSYESIQYAADNGYGVINLSWGSIGSYSQFNQDIINYAAIEKDVLIVAAGGNTDDDVFFFPASYDNVLSVAALNENDEKASFSTYNSNIDIAAPGVGIYSTVNGDGYGIDNGSSYASPLVAGVGALVRGQYPELTALEVAERIKLSADPIYDLPGNKGYTGKLGTGRLNAFRALTQQKFTQLNVTVDSIFQTNGELFFEDTVSIYLTIQNQESAVFLLEASLGSSSDYVIPIDSSYTIGYLENGSKIANGPFSFRLAKNTPASTPLSVFIKLTDGNRHESYHVIDFETSSNHQTLSNDSISLTIVDDGNLGYKPDGYFDGQGFKYQSNLTQDIGFFIHFNDSTLYDNLPYVISSGKVENDFVSKEILKPYSNADAKAYYFSVFEDSASNLLIESYAVLWDSLPGSALGISYRISNQSEDTLLNLRSGIFVDFDTQATAASSGAVYADSIAIIFDSLQVHQGIHLAADNSFFSLIDVSSLSDTLQKSDKQNLILSTQDSVGFDSVVNAAMIGGAYFPSLNPNSSQEFQLVLGAGDSLEHILQQLKLAAYRLTAFKEEPLIDSLIFACVEGAYDLVPEKGFDFYFFSDPLGADTLAFNDSIRIKNITSDSIIYLSKINTKGVSETIKGIQIKLFDNIADFRFPSDTIFLGDHPQNRVEITDLSVDPISWSWDFGGGSIATGIQNPSPIFADTGRFDVTLTIENIQGCSDQKTKSLTVLERPSPPELSIIGFCPGDSILIELTDTILMYPFESSLQAFFVGNSFHSAPLTSDTVLFISRKVNGIESKKAKVLLTENPTALDLKITSNLDSLQGFWASFTFEQEFISNVLWNLDTMSSFENPVDFPLLSDSLVLHYEVITDSSCVVVGDSTLQLTSSSAPTIPSFEVCNGEDVVISPEDGNAFGFYLDSLLSQPLHKGTSYRIDSLTSKITLFVVGLDSLLPSAPVPVEISPIDYQFEILSSQDSIYLNLNRSISFEVSEESERVIWYIDSVQQAITLTPTLFFTTPGVYQIVAEGWHAAGCTYTDSMLVSVLEEYIEPLNLDPQGETLLFPTPSSDYLLYEHQLKIKSIQAYDLTGKQHTVSFDLNKVDLTPLPQGLFFLEIETQNGLIISFKGIKSTKK